MHAWIRDKRTLLVHALLKCFAIATALALWQMPLRQAVAQEGDRVAEVLQAVAAGTWQPQTDASDTGKLVSDLIAIVRGDNPSSAELAIRALAMLEDKASTAVDAICGKLGDRNHSTRAFAVDALVAIGGPAVAPLRNRLSTNSPRERAAAIDALGRMRELRVPELETFLTDPDPRVRAAVAPTLSLLADDAVPHLVSLAGDQELAVSVAAARALAINRTNPELAVPQLTKLIALPDRAAEVVKALANYGTDARSADYPRSGGDGFG